MESSSSLTKKNWKKESCQKLKSRNLDTILGNCKFILHFLFLFLGRLVRSLGPNCTYAGGIFGEEADTF